MELILNVIGAVICASMAKKRGRGQVRWFLLGLFFHVLAAGALLLLGYRDRSRASVSQESAVGGWPMTRQDVTSRGQAQQQRGQVDLNALRAAVRSGGGMGQRGPSGDPAQPENALTEDRHSFLELIEEVAPTIDFSSLPPQVGRNLRNTWLRLGRILVESGEAGGVTNSSEFYQLDPVTGDLPVLFYPVAPNQGASPVVIQFACPVKRFRRTSSQLASWVDARQRHGFADATLFHDPNAGEVVLLAAGTRELDSAPVNAQTLGEWCRQVRLEAEGLKRDIPTRFGGIWV